MTSDATDAVRVIVLSGPSGSGKTTIVSRLMETAPVKLHKCVSATTRPPRTGEVDGDAYYFLSRDEFLKRRENDEFVEFAEVFASGHFYGTLRSEVDRASASGAWAFLEIDVHGAINVMQSYPEAVSVFLRTPEQEYERRLRSRGTETEEVIQRRINTAREELQFADLYQHQVVNDDLDRAVAEISNILQTQEKAFNA